MLLILEGTYQFDQGSQSSLGLSLVEFANTAACSKKQNCWTSESHSCSSELHQRRAELHYSGLDLH